MNVKLTVDPWQTLRQFTNARIALGRSGVSLPTSSLMAFNLAHAQARDAVHQPFGVEELKTRLCAANFTPLCVASAAPDRGQYLRRPDLGRQLSQESHAFLRDWRAVNCASPDVLFVVADGLSALAAEKHAMPLLDAVMPKLQHLKIGPIVIASQARVALADEIGELIGTRMVVIFIGERPGLSSPDSLGIYLTYAPRVGRTDAERNCISNVRPEGLGYVAAAHKLHYLLAQAFQLGLTGVNLKDGEPALA